MTIFSKSFESSMYTVTPIFPPKLFIKISRLFFCIIMHEYFLIKKLLVKIFMGKSFTISLEHFTGDLNVYVTNDDPHVYVMLTDDLNV
jgi:hypothetical protein